MYYDKNITVEEGCHIQPLPRDAPDIHSEVILNRKDLSKMAV